MHSRVPVYDETRGPEHIVGVIYSKDLARLIFFRTAAPVVELKLSQVMREVLVVPETKIRPRPDPRVSAAPPPDGHRGGRVRLDGGPGHRRGRH
jgi:hypothetical protein